MKEDILRMLVKEETELKELLDIQKDIQKKIENKQKKIKEIEKKIEIEKIKKMIGGEVKGAYEKGWRIYNWGQSENDVLVMAGISVVVEMVCDNKEKKIYVAEFFKGITKVNTSLGYLIFADELSKLTLQEEI
jgi:hypothetical protein